LYRYIVITCLSIVTTLFAQDPTESFVNSGGDSLFFISKGTIYCGNNLSYIRANGIYTPKDGYISYEDIEHGLANPRRHIASNNFTLGYALTNRWIVSGTIPYLISDKFIFHPIEGYERFYQEADENDGVGDIRLNMFRQSSPDSVTMFFMSLGLKMRNADWEDSGLGSGQSDYILGLGFGQIIGKSLILNLNAAYTYTDILRYSISYSWNSQNDFYYGTYKYILNPGNFFELEGHLTKIFNRNLLAGFGVNGFLQSETFDRGREIKDSGTRGVLISTELSYRILDQRVYSSIAASKLISGQNVVNSYGLDWGIHVFF